MRFQVSSVMDAIEQRLTTDVAAAQAVVDLGDVIRCDSLDSGRSVNLVRVGMVIDALCRYLIDEGAMLYGVVARELLSDQAMTSKERMVLGRWTDDGLIETYQDAPCRAMEVSDLTGLPLITVGSVADALGDYPWLAEGGGRVLQAVPRHGAAALTPVDIDQSEVRSDDPASAGPVVGTAKVPTSAELADGATTELPLPAEVLTGRAAARLSHTRIAQRRFMRAEPSPERAALLARTWRCSGYDCPAFGDRRQTGQPVPLLRDGVPVCPRHGEPITEVGQREPAYPVSIVVDDLPRRRLVVRAGQPVRLGRSVDDPDVVSVRQWLHEAAAAWISPVHLRLEASEAGLLVTDLSDNGTVVWQRSGPQDRGATRSLRRAEHLLGEWDTVELYTGIALARGDRRLATMLGRDEPASVLVNAPTAAHRQLNGG